MVTVKMMGQRGDRGTSRVDIGENTIVRYKHGKLRYEIVVDPREALKWKQNKRDEVDQTELFTTRDIFHNITKGERPTDEDLLNSFGDMTNEEMLFTILEKGELLLTQDQRNELTAKRRKEIVDYIHRHTINPKNQQPHPKLRIENALLQAGISLQEKGKVADIVPEIIQQLQTLLPMRFESIKLEIRMPSQLAGSIFQQFYSYGELSAEEWSGAFFSCQLLLPSGLLSDFTEFLNKRTKGKAQITIKERIEGAV